MGRWERRLNKVKEIKSLYEMAESELIDSPFDVNISTDSYDYTAQLKSETLSKLFLSYLNDRSTEKLRMFEQQLKTDLTDLIRKTDAVAKWSVIRAKEMQSSIKEIHQQTKDKPFNAEQEKSVIDISNKLLPDANEVRMAAKAVGKDFETIVPQLAKLNIKVNSIGDKLASDEENVFETSKPNEDSDKNKKN